jgi:LacI family transcriptional regulator
VPLTTTRSSIRKAGIRIAERLISEAAGRPISPQQEIWNVELIVRASTGPAPGRKAARSRRSAEAAE